MKSRSKKITNGIAYMYAIYNPDTDMYWSGRHLDLVNFGSEVSFYESEQAAKNVMEDSWIDFDYTTSKILTQLAFRNLERKYKKFILDIDISPEELKKAKLEVGKLEIVMVKAISLGHPYG